jgi:hypothetical protein
MKTSILPPNHHRSLSVTAQMVEQALDEMEELLRSRKNTKQTSRIERTYSEEERAHLLETISKLRRANAEMFVDLDLEASHYTENQIVTAKNTHLWTILVDSKSKGLRGFGGLSAEQARLVDAHVDKLLELLKEMQ